MAHSFDSQLKVHLQVIVSLPDFQRSDMDNSLRENGFLSMLCCFTGKSWCKDIYGMFHHLGATEYGFADAHNNAPAVHLIL